MNSDEQIKTIVGWMTVAVVILVPIAFVLIVLKLFLDTRSGIPLDLLNTDLLSIVAFLVFGLLFALLYGKSQLGWFQKKPRADQK